MKGFKEKREETDIAFFRDYSSYMWIMEQRGARTEGEKLCKILLQNSRRNMMVT